MLNFKLGFATSTRQLRARSPELLPPPRVRTLGGLKTPGQSSAGSKLNSCLAIGAHYRAPGEKSRLRQLTSEPPLPLLVFRKSRA